MDRGSCDAWNDEALDRFYPQIPETVVYPYIHTLDIAYLIRVISLGIPRYTRGSMHFCVAGIQPSTVTKIPMH